MPWDGSIISEWDDDNRTMRNMVERWFTDPATGRRWRVRKDLITDGATIPPLFWPVIGSPFTGGYRRGALAHDDAYSTLGTDKAAADKMLLHAALEDGCPRWQAWAIYLAVRWFGGPAFRADQEALAPMSPAVTP